MKIGISSWTYPWAAGITGFRRPAHPLTLPGLLEKAVLLRTEVVQVADNLPLERTAETEILSCAESARRFGIQIEIGTRGLGTEHLLRHLETAEKTGSSLVRTLISDGPDKPDFREAVRRIGKILPELEKRKIVLAVENHEFRLSSEYKALMEYFASPYLGICLDAVNNIGRGESFDEVIDNLGGYTVNFHCKDYVIRRKPTMLGFDITGAPVGEGMLDLKKAGEKLKDGISWIIELWTPFEGDTEQTIKLESEWAERSVANLKIFAGK